MKLNPGLMAVASLMLAITVAPARAAAPVAKIGAGSVSQATRTVVQSPAASSSQVDTYYLLQSLRDELRVLRGMLEEQGHAIRQLKQRQVDDYLDLDRRLSGLSVGAVSSTKAAPAGPVSAGDKPVSPTPRVAVSAGDGEKAAYDKAYGILKSGQIEPAKQAFIAYIAKYPRGRYLANGQYWLGEIYMLDNQLEEAREAFSVVVEQFPAHRKVLDASFKLGKVYYLLGDKAKAKALLSSVAATKGSAGKLAADYLKANF